MSLISSFLDLIYPPLCCSCGEKIPGHRLFFLCGDCAAKIEYIKKPVCGLCGLPGAEGFCRVCARDNFLFSFARAACLYAPPVSGAVKLLKYGKSAWLSNTLGKILEKAFGEFPELEEFNEIVPVPLSRVRFRGRGFNQAELLAEFAGQMLGRKVSSGNLARAGNSPPQASLAGKERRRNPEGVFHARRPEYFRGKRVMIVDDVFTTGSTVNECAKAVLASGAKSAGVLTLARSL